MLKTNCLLLGVPPPVSSFLLNHATIDRYAAEAHLFPYLVTEEDGPNGIECGAAGGFGNVRGGPRQSSLNAVLDSKMKHTGGKKKPGLLRGIGSMFRYVKNRDNVAII